MNATSVRSFLDNAESMLVEHRNSLIREISISKPDNVEEAIFFAKIISKLSPIIGNIVEYATVRHLNSCGHCMQGYWKRQDPDFPDATFVSDAFSIHPGIEVKAWFPFATEITARFRESSERVKDENIDIALVVWLPEHILWGHPKIIDYAFFPAHTVAKARDAHYFNPPGYLVQEPHDTSKRTRNLQQSNTEGFKLQETINRKIKIKTKQLELLGTSYSTDVVFQNKIKELLNFANYRSDSNFSKIDRIQHAEIEDFKSRLHLLHESGQTIKEWKDFLKKLADNQNSQDKLTSRELQLLSDILQ